ncbi:hypothetical protein C6499_22680 [Candidatus Poribacteria bacterium]|nr:MAG: hypothetical protein C6499_22680 [Candidatus Poribacteria bacterium]
MNSIAFTFRNRFILVKRNENPILFHITFWLIQPYKLVRAGWHLTSDRARIQPIKNGIHRRCYKAVRHMVTWIMFSGFSPYSRRKLDY